MLTPLISRSLARSMMISGFRAPAPTCAALKEICRDPFIYSADRLFSPVLGRTLAVLTIFFLARLLPVL